MRPRQAHSLRTGPRDDGWRSAGGVRSNKRTTVKVDPVSNLVAPVAPVDDDAPMRTFVRTVDPVVAFDREHRPAYN